MFKMIKTLSRLSTQDDLLKSYEDRIQSITGKIDLLHGSVEKVLVLSESIKTNEVQFQNQIETSMKRQTTSRQELEELLSSITNKIEDGKTEYASIGSTIKEYTNSFELKVKNSHEQAKLHIEEINSIVKKYEGEISALRDTLEKLSDNVSQLQC